jgi:hypothetical protein
VSEPDNEDDESYIGEEAEKELIEIFHHHLDAVSDKQ